MIKKSLFGTSGIRGDAEKLFTNQFSFDIGRAFAKFLIENRKVVGTVAVGMDPRESSPRIIKYFGSGIIYEKLDVADEGITPVPAINSILKANTDYAGSVMISGSHIKPYLNGIKFFAFGEEILKEHEAQIERIWRGIKDLVPAKDFSDKFFDENRANDTYIEYLLNSKKTEFPKWKVVVDPGCGAQSDVISFVLKQLIVDVIEINASVQQNFMSRDTEVEGDFEELQKKVLEEKADFGVGYDSDGDRVVFIDEKGNFIPGDYSGALIAKESGRKQIVTPINSSQLIERIGVKAIRTKVGSPYVVAAMKKNNIGFGYEANGGCIFEEMHSRDGGRTTIEMMNILAAAGKKLSELMKELPEYFVKRDKIEYEWSQYEQIIKAVKEEFSPQKIEELDGVKLWLDTDTWILFRSSQNAPEFRVFVESPDEKRSEELLKKGLELVKNAITK